MLNVSLPVILKSLASTVVLLGVYKAIDLIYATLTSPIYSLPGPPNAGFLFGNLNSIRKAEDSVVHEQWTKDYGKALRYWQLLGRMRLYTTDLRALQHILSRADIYEKPETARYGLGRILGDGVLVTEGPKHKQQRKIMNPAFGVGQIRELTDVFVAKSNQLRDLLDVERRKTSGAINILPWLSRATLDIIGLAGFNYTFNSLNPEGKPNELNEAFSWIFGQGETFRLLPFLKMLFKPLRSLPDEKSIISARATMARIGKNLIDQSKDALYSDSSAKDLQSRDLLTLLIRANVSKDIPEDQRMLEEDVLAQIPTFIVAGHETTSAATTWALFALSTHPECQKKLRNELLTLDTDTPTMEELNSLTYLDYVVRETLRIHAPVSSTLRVANKDDVIPLSTPIRDNRGRVLHEITIPKGQTVFIPILAINRDPELWGEESFEFRPERWENPPQQITSIPGVFGGLMSFLGGPRACIGYRFSLVETKTLLYTLVRAFEFELAVPKEDIGKKSSVVQRPRVKSDPDGGMNKMPLILKPYQQSI